jgi:hypothetical protein
MLLALKNRVVARGRLTRPSFAAFAANRRERTIRHIVFGPNHVAAGRVSRWATQLTGLPLAVHYLEGPRNFWADYLSRARDPSAPSSEGGGRALPEASVEGDAQGVEGDAQVEGDPQTARAAVVEGDALAETTAEFAIQSLEGEDALGALQHDVTATERNLAVAASWRE